MTAKFVPSLIVIPTCLSISVASSVPLDGVFRRGRCLSSSGDPSVCRRGGAPQNNSQIVVFPERRRSQSPSIEDSLFTSSKMKTTTSPSPLKHKTTRQANQCLRGRTGHPDEGKAEADAAAKYREGCGRPSTFLNPIQDSTLLSLPLAKITSVDCDSS